MPSYGPVTTKLTCIPPRAHQPETSTLARPRGRELHDADLRPRSAGGSGAARYALAARDRR